jgi:hypothetical protein
MASLKELLTSLEEQKKMRDQRFRAEAKRVHDIPKKSFLRIEQPPIHTFVAKSRNPTDLPWGTMLHSEAVAFEYICVVCGLEETYVTRQEGCLLRFKEVIVGKHL